MSIKVKVLRLPAGAVQPHHNADKLEIVQVDGYRSVVQKGQFHDGDLIAYLPEQAKLPESILTQLNLVGRLSTPGKDVISAIRLRGVVSQGICLPARPGWVEGQDVAEELGITKYLTPIPPELLGAVWSPGKDRTLKFDIRNVQEYPNVLIPGEEVVMTEKIHGTFLEVGVLPFGFADPQEEDVIITSKGLAKDGLAFDLNARQNITNPYVRVALDHEIPTRLGDAFDQELEEGYSIFLLAELFGSAAQQDLKYGLNGADFRVFALALKRGGETRFLDEDELVARIHAMGMQRVPVIYRGPYSPEILYQHSQGEETLTGKSLHMREGVVVVPVKERRDDMSGLGRVILKSKSEAYLLRSGATELE